MFLAVFCSVMIFFLSWCSVREAAEPRASQTQSPWQRPAPALPVASPQTQPLPPTVGSRPVLCVSAVWARAEINPTVCLAGGADPQRGEGESEDLNPFGVWVGLCNRVSLCLNSPSPRRERHRSKSPRRHRSRSRDRRHRSKSPGRFSRERLRTELL